MSEETGPDGIGQPLSPMQQATARLARLLGEPTDKDLVDCKAWFDASPDHRRLFESAMFATPMSDEQRQRIGDILGENFPGMPRSSGVGASKPEARQTPPPIQPWGPRRSPAEPVSDRLKRRPLSVLIGITAAASVAVIVLGVGFLPNLTDGSLFSTATAQDFQTGHGDIRSFSLADGTDLKLDSDSRVEVTIDRHQRHALLHQGRARFIVKADPRPFIIEVANRQVVSNDATVDVEVDQSRRANVQLRTGAASVQTDGRDARTLVIDQPISYAPDKSLAAPADTSVDTRDWPNGMVEYRSVALGVLIAQANRYAKVPIVLDDPSLATLQAAGRFKLTDTDLFVSRLAEPFGLKVTKRADGIHLSR